MQPWVIKLLIAALSSAFVAIFGIFSWVLKKLLTAALSENRQNASKNLEMSRAILMELRAMRAHQMGMDGTVAGSIDGDITPIAAVGHAQQKRRKTD